MNSPRVRLVPRARHLPRFVPTWAPALALATITACGGSKEAAPTATSAVVGPAGGIVAGPDGLQVVIPAGALARDTTIGIARSSAGAPATPEAYPAADHLYEFTPHGLTFDNPVTVRAPVPAGVTTPLVFMASAGEDWKLLDARVVNGLAEWPRNGFSNLLMGTACTVPASMRDDPHWCAHASSYARVTSTPPQALVQTSPGDYYGVSGDAGSYRVDEAATLQFKTTFKLPGNCNNAVVTLRRFPYQGTSAGMWGPPQDLQTMSPTSTTGVNYLNGAATFDFPFDHRYAGKSLFTLVVGYSCPGVIRSSGVVTSWDYATYRSSQVGDGLIVEGNVPAPAVTYGVGGTVSGLVGAGGLVLRNNGTDDTPPINADGGFTFATRVGTGMPYQVTVLTHPAGQTCTVTNGSGTASADVTDVAVGCVTTYPIGGTVSGLVGTGLVLQDNGGDDLPIAVSGPFTFTTRVVAGSPYAVTVLTQPSGSTCAVQSGTGTANAPVTGVAVTCTSAGPMALVTNSGVTSGTNGLSVYRVDPSTGAMAFLHNAGTGNSPYAIAISPNKAYAYVTNQVGGTVSSYLIDNLAGLVSPIPLSSPQSLNASGIAMDRLGRFIWVANYGYHTVSTFSIGAANGALAAVAGSPQSTASLPYAITAHPTMDVVYVAHQSNSVTVYGVNPASGILTLQQTLTSVISSANGIAIEPSGRFAYVDDGGGICTFAITPGTGLLTSKGCVSAGGTSFALAVHPNGQFVYVVKDTVSNNVEVFAIEPTTGALTLVGSPVSAGGHPRGVTVDSAGTFLYVTNFTTNDVSAFSITGGGITLTPLPSGATVPAGSMPQGIAVSP